MAPARRRGPFGEDDAPPEAAAGPRSYSDEEVRDILRRAAEEETRPALPAPGTGHSLQDIEAAAKEAGIDPGAVRRAALARLPSRRSASLGERVFGPPGRLRHRAVVPGRLTDEGLDGTHADLEAVVGRPLRRERDGEWTVWEEDHRQGRTRIAVRDAGDRGVEVDVAADEVGWTTLQGLAGVGAAAAAALVLGVLVPGLPLLAVAAGALPAIWIVRRLRGPIGGALRTRVERSIMAVAEHAEAAALPPGEDDRPGAPRTLPPGGPAASP